MTVVMPQAAEPDAEALDIDLKVDRKRPMTDQVYEALRAAIIEVRLLPGTSISENRICRHFGVSRTPVRLAIARLAEEGLIDVYPQQGSFVSPIRLGSIHDSHFVRKSLELSILAMAAKLWSPAFSRESREIIACQAAAISAQNTTADAERFLREDERFHYAFARFARKEGVWPTVLTAKAKLGRFFRVFARPERLHRVVEEHTAIIDALDAGDPALAAERLDYHLDRVFFMIDQLPDQYRRYLAD